MNSIPVNKVRDFEEEFLSYMRNSHAGELAELKAGKLSDNATSAIEKVAADLSAKYSVEV